MFTSLYPSQHGARSLGCAVFPDCFSKLRADVPTVATILNQSGYYTLGIVNSGFLSKGFGFDRGFDEYYLHGPEQHIKKGIEKIEEYIPLLKQNKFFLFFHTLQVHAPFSPDPEFEAVFSELKDKNKSKLLKWAPSVWVVNLSNRSHSLLGGFSDEFIQSMIAEGTLLVENESEIIYSWRNSESNKADIVNLYDSEIRQMDYYLQTLFDELDKEGLLENTIIILTADHGEAFFGHHDNNKSLALGHFKLYDEVLHIPLIIHFPHAISDKINTSLTNLDILPTLLDILDLNGTFDFYGSNAFNNKQRLYFAEQFRAPGWKGLGYSNFKYIRENESGYKELYNLSKDPLERYNLASEYPKIVSQFDQLLKEYNAPPIKRYFVRSGFIVKEKDERYISSSKIDHGNHSKETMDALRRLGYI